MAIESFEKQSYEKFYVAADFVNVLDTGETFLVGNCSVGAVDVAGDDVTDTVLESGTLAVLDTTKLKVRVQAGIPASSPYKITFKILTSLENQYELDIRMKVKDL